MRSDSNCFVSTICQCAACSSATREPKLNMALSALPQKTGSKKQDDFIHQSRGHKRTTQTGSGLDHYIIAFAAPQFPQQSLKIQSRTGIRQWHDFGMVMVHLGAIF